MIRSITESSLKRSCSVFSASRCCQAYIGAFDNWSFSMMTTMTALMMMTTMTSMSTITMMTLMTTMTKITTMTMMAMMTTITALTIMTTMTTVTSLGPQKFSLASSSSSSLACCEILLCEELTFTPLQPWSPLLPSPLPRCPTQPSNMEILQILWLRLHAYIYICMNDIDQPEKSALLHLQLFPTQSPVWSLSGQEWQSQAFPDDIDKRWYQEEVLLKNTFVTRFFASEFLLTLPEEVDFATTVIWSSTLSSSSWQSV